MKKKAKIVVAATAVAITSLMMTAHHPEPAISPVSPQIAHVSEVVAESRTYTPPIDIEPIIAEVSKKISTQTEEITEPTDQQEVIVVEDEISQPQPAAKEKIDTTSTTDTRTPINLTNPQPTESDTPKNGDTRIVDGKQQGYLLGFGWVDYMGENEVVYCEGMYENGNKIGIMGGTTIGSHGETNKIVGIED